MKRLLFVLSAILIGILLAASIHSEPPYLYPPTPASHNLNSGTFESSALVDSSFSIDAEWIGDPQWMTGVNFGLETFNSSIARGSNFFGTNLIASQYSRVEIRLNSDSAQWSNAQLFRRDPISGTPYDSYGSGVFPGSAWDISDPDNPIRLNVCFVEIDDGTGPFPPPNGFWDPDTSERGKYEYLYVMRSNYDGVGNSYEGMNILYDDLDLMYTWCPRVADGHTFFESDTGKIVITPIIGLRSSSNNTSIALYWTNPGTDPYQFKIFYSDSSNPDQLLVQLTGDRRYYFHTQLLPGQKYYYRISSYDIDGDEIFSSPVIVGVTREITLQMDVFGQWNARNTYGDIWGYTDSVTGDEYALICARYQGVSIISIDDTPLVEVGFITGTFSGNDVKDVKTYSHFAVVFCEGAPTQIFDISDVFNPQFVSTIPGGRHNGLVDGHFVYLVGGSFGGLEIWSIEDPYNPVYVGEHDPFYYHDVAIRNDTMAACGIYGDGVDILDLADKQNPALIGHFNYPGSGAHNAAFSEDGQYVFIGDEIGTGNYTRVFDISNLDSIQLVSQIIANPLAITHNCYVKGKHFYNAYYAEGLRVWNIADPRAPYEVDYYDTHPGEYAGFVGVWGVFPYFNSDKIIISDMQYGLFVFSSTLLDTDCCQGYRGNINEDASELDVLDLIYLVNYIFRFGPEPVCPDEADVNNDGMMGNVQDLVVLINVIYRNAPFPPNCP